MPTNETGYTFLRSLPDGTTIEVEAGADYDDVVALEVEAPGDTEADTRPDTSSTETGEGADQTPDPGDTEADTPPATEPSTEAPSAPEAQE